MRRAVTMLPCAIIVTCAHAAVQPPAPPETSYGTAAEARAIELAMLDGDAASVVAALRAAQASRGSWLGCPTDVVQRTLMPPAPPVDGDAVRRRWVQGLLPRLGRYAPLKPEIGRRFPSLALAAAQAQQAGEELPAGLLGDVAAMLIDVQFGPHTVADTNTTLVHGSFGYPLVSAGHPWDPGGVPGDATRELYEKFPQAFVTYTHGRFAGTSFGVADALPQAGLLDGGAGYDHGFAGSCLLAIAGQAGDATLVARAERHARLAADWAIAEPPVRNHNYTAKLVWFLARHYGRTGEAALRAGLMDKLRRNLLPGVLMDRNADGRVDGVEAVAFADLCPAAQLPGRFWDGHNSLPWYQAINAWALVEAYAALRDRGDSGLAAEVRPYACATVDNLAHELVHLGLGDGVGPGFHDVVQAILSARWAIDRAEGSDHPTWRAASRLLWRHGEQHGLGSDRNIGLWLLVAGAVPYTRPGQSASPVTTRRITLRCSVPARAVVDAVVYPLLTPRGVTLPPGSHERCTTIALRATDVLLPSADG